MRVLQAMAGAQNGGAEAFFGRLVTALHEAGLDQRVVIRRDAARSAMLREAGIEPVELGFGGRFDLATPMALRRQIRSFKPDVVLTWMNRATTLCPRGRFVHAARLGGYYDLKYYRHCDHLIGNTEAIVRYLEEQGWPSERAHYLPNFVDDTPAEPISRRTLYTPNDAPVILALGRLHENKAFDTLLRALVQVPGVYLWLAGEGPERQALETLAAKLAVKPRVRFLGWRDDVAALFATADLFVCPSRHEPLGNVVVESWAHGLPVVATGSDGPAALIDDGESGLLAPVDDPAALAMAMRRLLSDRELWDRIAAGGTAAYQAKFTKAHVVAAYMRFFERVAA